MIYLDNAATSFPKPPAVVAAVERFLTAVGANPGRSGHRLSAEAARVVFTARAAVAELLGVADQRRVVFTANATGALNLALAGFLAPGDHVVTTSLEHNSVMRPLRRLRETRGIEVDIVCADPQGRLDPGALRAALRPRTRLVAVNHGSNVNGRIAPLAEIRRAIGAVALLVDAAQTAGAVPIEAEALGIDLLAFTGHKSLLGPQGTGGLYIRPGIEIEPLLQGGTGSGSDSDAQPAILPDRFESGTPNGPGLAGLGAGAEFVAARGLAAERERGRGLLAEMVGGLRAVEGLTFVGGADLEDRLPTVSIRVAGLTPSELAFELDRRCGVMTRAGLHCAPEAHRTMGSFPDGAVRLSAGPLTEPGDVRRAAAAVAEIAAEARR
ncbi:MAG: aminotransferase class V-fold PLP-dependent enzyme [Candidatus Eisenbacteria bacterium]|uniref:cysteine desulfurase n=1 Tax=Eiseniibacteriota bacterium TaxID=2212470 RepID=A0A938BQ44_UNCEI|nr:aminotransferase class V-fold PLP-dependent enzyme [Candidatus Eisenbacteria bacterium]